MEFEVSAGETPRGVWMRVTDEEMLDFLLGVTRINP